jgi:hypothetical protein
MIYYQHEYKIVQLIQAETRSNQIQYQTNLDEFISINNESSTHALTQTNLSIHTQSILSITNDGLIFVLY